MSGTSASVTGDKDTDSEFETLVNNVLKPKLDQLAVLVWPIDIECGDLSRTIKFSMKEHNGFHIQKALLRLYQEHAANTVTDNEEKLDIIDSGTRREYFKKSAILYKEDWKLGLAFRDSTQTEIDGLLYLDAEATMLRQKELATRDLEAVPHCCGRKDVGFGIVWLKDQKQGALFEDTPVATGNDDDGGIASLETIDKVSVSAGSCTHYIGIESVNSDNPKS